MNRELYRHARRVRADSGLYVNVFPYQGVTRVERVRRAPRLSAVARGCAVAGFAGVVLVMYLAEVLTLFHAAVAKLPQ